VGTELLSEVTTGYARLLQTCYWHLPPAQLKIERATLQQRLDAALAADSSAAAVDVQLAEAADARIETTRLASENDRYVSRHALSTAACSSWLPASHHYT
jgi:hypothetical protein